MATGVNTAAVPVLDKKPDNTPVISMTATMSIFSVLAIFVTTLPTTCATPVSKNAAPTINMAINKRTLPSTKPAKASLGDKTPDKTRPTDTNIAVIDKGIFSHTNITMANTK